MPEGGQPAARTLAIVTDRPARLPDDADKSGTKPLLTGLTASQLAKHSGIGGSRLRHDLLRRAGDGGFDRGLGRAGNRDRPAPRVRTLQAPLARLGAGV
jgi:hypothetical protein